MKISLSLKKVNAVHCKLTFESTVYIFPITIKISKFDSLILVELRLRNIKSVYDSTGAHKSVSRTTAV